MAKKEARRIIAQLRDKTGILELCWFQGINWVEKNLHTGKPYLVFGKVVFFNGKAQITHPEIEPWAPAMADGKSFLEPVYPTTEKLKARGLNGKQIGKLTMTLMDMVGAKGNRRKHSQLILFKSLDYYPDGMHTQYSFSKRPGRI